MTLSENNLVIDLYSAFYKARKHKSKKGYVKRFESNLDENVKSLSEELLNRTYKPEKSSCFIIDHPKKREVFAAQFRDRVVHHLYFNYTHELFERTFIQDSYSCIKDRGTHYGIERLRKHILQESRNYTRKCYVLKIDIRGYFMHINRKKLLEIATDSIRKMAVHKVSKGSCQRWKDVVDIDFVLWLTEEIITIDPILFCDIIGKTSDWNGLDAAKCMKNAPDGCGLPIGNLTSQLLSNVYLNILDQFMKRILGCRHYGRYVDDAYVVSSDKHFLLSIIPKVRKFLKEELGLDLHMGKLAITDVTQGVEFLGAFVKPYRTYISNQSLRRMVNNVNALNYKDREKACCSINSFLGVLSHYSSYNIRCNMFITAQVLSISSLDKDVTKLRVPYQRAA